MAWTGSGAVPELQRVQVALYAEIPLPAGDFR